MRWWRVLNNVGVHWMHKNNKRLQPNCDGMEMEMEIGLQPSLFLPILLRMYEGPAPSTHSSLPCADSPRRSTNEAPAVSSTGRFHSQHSYTVVIARVVPSSFKAANGCSASCISLHRDRFPRLRRHTCETWLPHFRYHTYFISQVRETRGRARSAFPQAARMGSWPDACSRCVEIC